MHAAAARARSSLVWALFVAASASAQKSEDVGHVDPGTRPEPGAVHQWRSPQGRPYWYRVPKKISKTNPPALIFMLHGTGGSEGWSFWNYPIATGGFRPDDIVVSPDGVTPGAGDTFNFVQGKPDGEQIAALIGVFRAAFPIGRVYLYGHSQGAFFSYWFAGEYPELVDGIVAHAGNVLSVKHSKASRTGVAIGILHGEADAVVPVECAHRSEKIYVDEGYDHVRKRIVEGLTERSGHWPLPGPVSEMLDWLDEVTESSPWKALDAAWRIAADDERPELDAVRRRVDQARALAKRQKPSQDGPRSRAVFDARIALLDRFLEEAGAAHLAALGEDLRAAVGEYGVAAAHLRHVRAALEGRKSWDKALAPIARTLKNHDRACAKAAKALGQKPDGKRFRKALAEAEESYLGASYPALVALLRDASSGDHDFDVDDVTAFEALRKDRESVEQAAREAAAELQRTFAAAFREAHPELVVDED